MPDSERLSRDLLDDATLAYLRQHGGDEVYAEGEIIIRRGEPGRSLFVLLDGEVEARLQGSDGRHLSLARMGPGATFGELAILRQTPTSADVVAVSTVRVLAYPPEHLPTALAECPPLRNKLLNRMAGHLQDTTLSTWKHYQRAEALVSLVRGDGTDTPMVAVSARMRSVVKQLDAFATSSQPVLICGEAGTGKLLAARRVHDQSARRGSPLIVVNCEQLPPDTAHTLLFGSLLEAGGGADPCADLGSLHVAHEGTMVLRNLDTLPRVEQVMLAKQLARRGDDPASLFPDVRLIATSRHAADLVAPLAALFGEAVELPPLADRPRDIVPLAYEFLRRTGADPPHELSDSAEHALVSLRYQHRNVAELGDVIELAVSCAEDRLVEAEHIFGGVAEDLEPDGIDLCHAATVERLTRRPVVQTIRAVTLVGFAAAVVICLAFHSTSLARHANALIWSLWEPVVFVSFLLVGAVWCTVCPLSSAGRLAQRALSLDLAHPPWLKRHGATLSLAGFFAIVAVERIFHMTGNPLGSGLLLLGLIGAAVVFGMLFKRELWCRHLCPLGRLASALAPGAPLYVGASRSVCASTCTSHECFKGTEDIPGCTVFHHPQQIAEAHLCKLCLDCVHSCPHSSTRAYLRLPLVGLSRLPSSAETMQTFVFGIFLLAPILLAAQGGGRLATTAGLLGAGAAAVLAAAIAGPPLLALLGTGADRGLATRIAFTMALLAWGPLIAYQLGNVLILHQLTISAAPGSLAATVIPAGLTFDALLRLAAVLLAGAAAAAVAHHIRRLARREGHEARPLAWHALQAVAAAYVAWSAYLSLF